MKHFTIAFIGLGNMGLPMAKNLAVAGNTVDGFDPAISEALVTQSGIHLSQSLEQAVTDSHLVVTMLPNGAVVLDTLQQIISVDPDLLLSSTAQP